MRRGQVTAGGRGAAGGGAGAEGTSALDLCGGEDLGPMGAGRLAELLRGAGAWRLRSLEVRWVDAMEGCP